MWCEQAVCTTRLSLIFIVFVEINRIEERLITVLKKLHMDVKERRWANRLAHANSIKVWVLPQKRGCFVPTQVVLRKARVIFALANSGRTFQTFSPEKWWAWAGSNCRPHDYQSCALAS